MLESELNEVSKGLGMVQRGEVIISQGELVTESNYQELESIVSVMRVKIGKIVQKTGLV